MVNRERLLHRFLELVRIDGVSGDEGEVARKVVCDIESLGFGVERDNCGEKFGGTVGNVLARIPGSSDCNAPTVLLAAHLDVIESVSGIEPVVSGDVIKTSGTTILGADDRAGVAILLEVLETLKDTGLPHPDLEMLFTVGEENGLNGARFLELPLKAKMGIVLDSGGPAGSIVTVTPSHYDVRARIYGRSAHAGVEPDKGISAIQIAARAISRMNLGRIDGETTANIGYIKGGTVANAVPAFVEIGGETRSLSEEKLERQVSSMRAALIGATEELGGQLDLDIKRSFRGYNLGPEDTIVRVAMDAGQAIGLPVQLTARGGGSDANVFNERGIPCINLAIGIRDDHSPSESIDLTDMVKAAEHVLEILKLAALLKVD